VTPEVYDVIRTRLTSRRLLFQLFSADVLSTVALMLYCCVCRQSVRNVLWLNGAS